MRYIWFVTNNSDRIFDSLVEAVERLYPAVYHRYHRKSSPVPGTEITQRMAEILQLLAVNGPLTLGELAENWGLGKATVTEVVDRIEAKALVARFRDDRDRRRVFLALTGEGEKAVRALGEVLEDSSLRKALRAMDPDDRTALVQGLEALLRAGEEEHHD